MKNSSSSLSITNSSAPFNTLNHFLLMGVITVFGLSACSAENTDVAEKNETTLTTSNQPQETKTPEENTATPASTPSMADQSSAQEQSVAVAFTPSAERGQKTFRQCSVCHTADKDGGNRVGPNLYGIYGAEAGNREGFKYSKAMLESQIVWNEESLDGYLEKPSAFLPRNRMTFGGIKNSENRADVIAYLKSLQD